MWTREGLKTYAKGFLKKHYWKAFLVCLIVALLTGSGTRTRTSRNEDYRYSYRLENKIPMEINNPVLNYTIRMLGKSPVAFFTLPAILGLGVLGLILWITVGYALEVGQARFFLRGFNDDVEITNLFSTFNKNEYLNIVGTIFLRNIFTFLWSLLLIIPGIIKSYEYRMVPYIISEYPQLGATDAIDRSREITNGHKMDMFILDLSFLGWGLLGLLFFGIGGIFVKPYIEATYAKLYNTLSGNDDLIELH